MASIDEIKSARIDKLKKLEEAGINPYPVSSKREYSSEEATKDFSKLSKKKGLWLAGRIMAKRGQGALMFIDLFDGTGKFQSVVKKDEMKKSDFELLVDTVDIGDFIEIKGSLFETKRKEKSILAKEWNMLAKSLRSLPEKWHGLQDTEERFRRRYLDLLMNEEVRDRFSLRSKVIKEIRNFFDYSGYMEVETPRLQALAGGATAKPFVTHFNALDIDLYLTIAQELYLKQLLIGGFNKVYEIGRKFRNEGIDVTHNPEFTMLESQEAYADAKGQREFTEKLFKYLIKKVIGKSKVENAEGSIDFSKKFEVVTFYDLLKRYALIPDPSKLTKEESGLKAKQLGIDVVSSDSLEKILDNIYKKACRPKLVQPTFIIDYPVSFNPFAKRKEEDPSLIDRFQLVIGGVEMVNAFSELNNPIDQSERYQEQDKKKKQGEGEISPSDEAYVEAMEYGMPPNGGIGIGIDRVVMFFMDVQNIREAIFFPTLRPKKE